MGDGSVTSVQGDGFDQMIVVKIETVSWRVNKQNLSAFADGKTLEYNRSRVFSIKSTYVYYVTFSVKLFWFANRAICDIMTLKADNFPVLLQKSMDVSGLTVE